MNFNQFVKGYSLELFMKTINISELVSFLQSNPNITKLSLKSCFICDEETKALANGNLANLTQLNLSLNKISDEGAKALANGNLTKLTQLDVNFNKFGDEGAKALVGLKNKVNVKGTEIFEAKYRLTQSDSSIEIFDPTQSESKTTLDDIIIPESLKKELNKILDIIPEKK